MLLFQYCRSKCHLGYSSSVQAFLAQILGASVAPNDARIGRTTSRLIHRTAYRGDMYCPVAKLQRRPEARPEPIRRAIRVHGIAVPRVKKVIRGDPLYPARVDTHVLGR
jgi:hypothetical protein